MKRIFPKVLDYRLQRIVVGGEIEIERGAEELACAVGHPEHEGGGHLASRDVINLAPQA